MTIIEQIKAEIERLKGQLIRGACAAQIEMETNCKEEAYNEVLSFLDTLEPEKPAPKDLEEAANNYLDGVYGKMPHSDLHIAIFIAGAKWQADHNPLPEDTVLFNKGVAEGKRLMMDEWLKDRDGCFWDGVEEGKKAMKDAILAIIESRLSEIIGDAQPKPALRAELEELINKIKK